MSMDKIYGIANINTAVFTINVKGVKMKLNFTGGNANGTRTSYATLRTKNRLVQSAIERMPAFGKTIKLLSVYGYGVDLETGSGGSGEGTTVEQKPEGGSSSVEVVVVDEVSDLNGARDYLIKKMKVPYQALNNVEAMRSKAAELRVAFPNVEQLAEK